ncbi:TonB-dependent receptor domain-containing protein [Flavobacterium sp. 3HN19-14]|uniref:TonB-dependent receptor domain-containing protein n=1 Tax=Flavobacterium sp. 3HN19-14 TaxID=3448133 RepID=UPI003EE0B090
MDETVPENVIKDRNFFLFGVGLSYKPKDRIEFYGNVSQNYRSVTFNDIRTFVPNQEIDPNITDEKGFTSDIGVRGQLGTALTFDASVYGLLYDDKIGDVSVVTSTGTPGKIRKNIGTALTYGFETMFDWSISKSFFEQNENFSWHLFSNVALTNSEYTKSEDPNIEGNEVEFVPKLNLKTGTGVGYKNLMISLQFTYLSSQFTDANNRPTDSADNSFGIFGEVPSYYVADISASYKWKNWKLEAGINNFTDNSYFTRRATGYPWPGIIPSDMRTFYTTLEFTF